MTRITGLIVALLLSWSNAAAQSGTSDLTYTQLSVSVGGEVRSAALYVPPNYDGARSWPLIVYLHGGGGNGNDTGGDFASRTPISGAIRSYVGSFPALVLIPRSPVGKIWAPVPRNPLQSEWRLNLHGTEPAPDAEDYLTASIEGVLASYSVDEERVSLTGHSMGGEGAMRYGALHADRFSGIAASAGSAMVVPEDAPRLAQMGIWIFQGATDQISTTELARASVAGIRAAGGDPRYSEFEGVGHEVVSHVYSDPELIDWLVSQRRRRSNPDSNP